jgi:hypothetical protein
MSQHTIEKCLCGEAVKRKTHERVFKAVHACKSQLKMDRRSRVACKVPYVRRVQTNDHSRFLGTAFPVPGRLNALQIRPTVLSEIDNSYRVRFTW